MYQSVQHEHRGESLCHCIDALLLSPLDADRTVLPLVSEKQAQFVWHAPHRALYSAHQ